MTKRSWAMGDASKPMTDSDTKMVEMENADCALVGQTAMDIPNARTGARVAGVLPVVKPRGVSCLSGLSSNEIPTTDRGGSCTR
jgi:hypothetical protein